MAKSLDYTIVGVDPGLNKTGYAFLNVKDYKCSVLKMGVISTHGSSDLGRRISLIVEEMRKHLTEFSPEFFVVEKIYSHIKYPYTSVLMAHARGALLLCAMERGMLIKDLPASRVKKAITGNGKASKEQVRSVLSRMFEDEAIEKQPLDASDALALALGYVFLERKF